MSLSIKPQSHTLDRLSKMVLVASLFILIPVPATARAELPQRDVRRCEPPDTRLPMELKTYDSLSTWRGRRAWLREQVRCAAGLWPEPEKIPLKPKIFGRIDRGDHTIEKVYFQSRPGLFVTGNLYRPKQLEGRRPAILCPHGHWKRGRLNHEERGSVPARCIMLARLGAVVFAYDMVGYNDSAHQINHKSDLFSEPANALWGIGPLQMQTLNSVRVVDFLQSLPDVNPQQIGITGASGGGTQTFILSAVDDRVQVAAPVNMISSIMQGGCICENAPCLRIDTNNVEIGAIFAPKPLLMVSATGDWTRLTPRVEYPAIHAIYDFYGAANRVFNVHIDAPHNYNLQSRQAVYRFMARWLLNRDNAETITEHDIDIPADEDLLVFADGKTPPEMLPLDKLIETIKHDTERQIATFAPINTDKLAKLAQIVRVGLKHAIGSDWPTSNTTLQAIISENSQNDQFLGRDGRYVRIRFRSDQSQDRDTRTVVVFDPQGVQAADKNKIISGEVVFAEPFGAGNAVFSAQDKKNRKSAKFFTTFNRTDTAETVYDMLTVLTKNLSTSDREQAIVGRGRMGPALLVARTMIPDEIVHTHSLRTVIDMNGFDSRDDADYLADLYLPNIRKLGGVRSLAAVAANGPIWLHNLRNTDVADWAKQAAKLNGVEIRVTTTKATNEQIADWLAN